MTFVPEHVPRPMTDNVSSTRSRSRYMVTPSQESSAGSPCRKPASCSVARSDCRSKSIGTNLNDRGASIPAAASCAIFQASLRPHPGPPVLRHHRMVTRARGRIEALGGRERPVIFVDRVRLGVGQQLAGFQKLVKIGDEPDLVAGDSAHDMARLDLARMLKPGGARELAERAQ